MSQNNAAVTVQHVPERKLDGTFILHKKRRGGREEGEALPFSKQPSKKQSSHGVRDKVWSKIKTRL